LKDVTEPDFTAFVADRQQALLRLAMILCGDARQAEDIVADVLARAYEKWTRVSGLDQPYAYVRRMVVNEFLSWRRRAGRAFPVARLDDLVDAEPDHALAHADRDALIDQLATLPRQQRATLVLRYYEGLSDAEIAGVLGCGESTVRSNASRALASLRIGLSPLSISARET
jgi:RNA polymerase sigma-70 factor (sigma-E family)